DAMTSGFKEAISAVISGCGSLQRLWFSSRLRVATRNCIGLSWRLRIHRLCWVTIPLSRRGVYRMWVAALLLLVLYLAPVLVSLCLPDPRGGVPWHQARRDPTRLSPDPAVTQEAVIQVFAAPAVSWRGVFSVHTWIAVKPTGAPRFTRYEVLGFGVANGAPALRIDRMGPDNYWFGARPQILLDRRGAGVDGMVPRVRDAVASYPYPCSYRPWPGPNSNTFLAHIARQVPELELHLFSNAVGK